MVRKWRNEDQPGLGISFSQMLAFSSCWVRGWSSASWRTLSTWETGLAPHTFRGFSSCSAHICITSPAVCSETWHIRRKGDLRFYAAIVLIFKRSACNSNSPMVMLHVSSRVCWATERTSGTLPVSTTSHFFLSPPEDGLSSGDTDVAGAEGRQLKSQAQNF